VADRSGLATLLDAAHGAKPRQVAASVRHPAGAEVIEFPFKDGKGASDQGVSSWGGEDSNLRPTDYESDPALPRTSEDFSLERR